MKQIDFEELLEIARKTVYPKRLSDYVEVGGVAAAILTQSGNVYTGVCIDTACSMGFCAEHAAAAAMITAREQRIIKLVAVNWEGNPIPPCGRCREFLSQLDEKNGLAEVMVRDGVIVTLEELLPYDWKK